ncbi:MAG TPA: hypothetical protein VID28_22980 [Methylomirabilota bacterium]
MRPMRYAALVGALLLLPSTSPAQEAVDASSLRLRWEVDPPVSGLQTVCGRVFNDRPTSARRVRLRLEGLDAGGAVTARRDGEVLGQISSGSAGLFCISMQAGAASYRVTIVTVEWVTETQSP